MPGEEAVEAPAALAAKQHETAEDISYPSPRYGAFGEEEADPEY